MSLDSLWQKDCQISVKFWIFNDPIHKKGTSIGHFGTTGDEIINIRNFFEEKRVLEVVEAIEISEAAEVNEAA